MKEYIKTIAGIIANEIVLKHIPVESEPEGDCIKHEIEELITSNLKIVSNRIELLERKVNNLYKENKTLEQKYEFLMDTITDDQVDELKGFCEANNI